MFKTLIRLLVALIALAPPLVSAQQFPLTMPPNTVYGRLGINTGPGQAIPLSILFSANSITNIAALRALPVPPPSTTIYVAGYTSLGDGGQGTFEYNPASSAGDNGGTIIAPNIGSGRWIRGLPLANTFAVEWFGANVGSADNTATIQSAVTALTAGGTLLFQNAGYNITGTITISSPMTLSCPHFTSASTGNINATGSGNTIFKVNASDVTISGCLLNRAGSAVGTAIAVGSDYTTVTDAQLSSSSTTLTSPTQAHFTSADVGKDVACTGAGAGSGQLTTTIASLISPTQVVLAVAASTSANPTTCNYGTRYNNFILRDGSVVNHAIGLLLQDASQYHVNNIYFNATNPVQINQLTGVGGGASDFSGNTFLAANSSYGVVYNSGADVRFVNNKFLGGIYNFYMNWNFAAEGNLFIQDSSLENFQTASIFITTPATFERIVISGNSFAGPGATAIATDNSSASTFNDLIIANNTIRTSGTTTTGVSIGKTNQCLITGNQFDLSGNSGTIGVALLSNSNTCLVRNNYYNVAAGKNITNAGTANLVDEIQGITFANLPSSMANGSRQFISDGAQGTSPCSGSSTGATAFRHNGAWVCPGPQAISGITGLGTGVATALGINVGSAGAPVVQNGALGTPSSGTLTSVTGLPLTTGVTGTLPIANGGTNNASAYSTGSIPYSNGTSLTQDNTKLYWDDPNQRLCINVGAGCSFPLSVFGVSQWGATAAGAGIRYQYGGTTSSGTDIVGINYNNNTLNQIGLSATGNDDLSVGTDGNTTVRVGLKMPNLLLSSTAPTIASGCGGGAPTISAANGTGAFRVTIGTAVGSTCVINMPAATAGWNCYANDLTTHTTANSFVMQTASATNQITLTGFSDIMGVATWVASDVIAVSCYGL